MIKKLTGIISDASEVEHFTKRDGSLSCKCTLKITADSNDGYPNEVAVNAIGDNTNYAFCKGMQVEVKYVSRVYEYVKDGRRHLGNDVFLYSIKRVNQDEVVNNPLNSEENEKASI